MTRSAKGVFFLATLGLSVVLVAAARHAPPIREVSDGAVLEIYTLRAMKGALLVGPYSRFGWHHPGPLFFYLEAPWYWLSGLRTAGMQAGALAINMTAAALIVWTVVTVASAPLAIAVSTAVAWYALRAGDLLVSVWNPHVIVLPLVAFVVVAAALAAGAPSGLLLWLVALGAFLVQTHLAMTPIVAVVGAIALVPIARRQRSSGVWLAAIVLQAVLWMPPLVEELTRAPGNLTRIVMFFEDGPGGQKVSVARAAWASMMTAAFRSDFAVAVGRELIPAHGWTVPAALFLLAGLVAVAFLARNRDPLEKWLASACAVATTVALAATVRIHDQIVDHEIFWMSALGALNAGVIAGGLAAAIRVDWRRLRRLARPVCAVAWVLIAAVGLNGMRHALNRARTVDDHAIDALTEEIDRYLMTSGARRPLFHIEAPVWPIAAGALLQIDKRRTPFAVDRQWVPMFGEWLAADGREDGEATIAGSPLQPVLVP